MSNNKHVTIFLGYWKMKNLAFIKKSLLNIAGLTWVCLLLFSWAFIPYMFDKQLEYRWIYLVLIIFFNAAHCFYWSAICKIINPVRAKQMGFFTKTVPGRKPGATYE